MSAANAIRLARRSLARRSYATAATTFPSAGAASAPSSHVEIPLVNIEAQWERMPEQDQAVVFEQLEELQKKNWKELSLAEKKAAYYINYGPHGPRKPLNPPGSGIQIFASVLGLIGVTAVVFYGLRSLAAPPPRTITKEWQEASNERAKELNLNPISGISSEGYKGKGFVTESK